MYKLFNIGKVTFVVFFAFAISFHGFSQDFNRIDSLKGRLKDVSEKNKIDVLRLISLAYAEQDTVQALHYINIAYDMSVQQSDSTKMIRTGVIKVLLLQWLDKMEELIVVGNVLLPIAEHNRNQYELKIILNSLAAAYTEKGKYDESLKYNLKSLIAREADGDKSEISISLSNIGLVYYRLKSYKRAIEYNKRSIQLKEEIGVLYDLDRVYINLGIVYKDLGNFSEAKKNILKGLSVCGGGCGERIKVEAQEALGSCYYEEGNLEKAEKHFKESLRMATTEDTKKYQALNLISLAKIAIKRNNYKKAKEDLLQAEEYAKTIGFNEILIETYEQFYFLFDQTHDYEKSSLYRKKYIQLHDSIFSSELINNLAKIQSEFDQRENIKTIADRDKLVALQNESIAQARQQVFFVVVISILIIGLATLLYRFNKSQQKVTIALSDAKRTIEKQNAELLDSNKLLDRLVEEKTHKLDETDKALVRANEERDHFIYKTSHDIQGPLATMKGMANLAMMDVKDPIILDYLKKLDGTAGKLNSVLSRMLIVNQINHSEIKPEFIDLRTMVDDILKIETIRGIPARLKICVDIDKDIIFRSDKELVKIIFENLINNAIKFYNDSVRATPFVEVCLKKTDSGIVLTVRDNGIGIAYADREKIFQMFMRVSERSQTGGMGLYLSRLATEKVKGNIDVKTTTEGYTEFVVVFPYDLALIQEKQNAENARMSLSRRDSGKQNNLQAS